MRSITPNAVLHYHNPVRSIAEIKHAVDRGVMCFSVDRVSELEKLLDHIPKGCEISARLKLDIKGAAYDFGIKFGAAPDLCVDLLRRIQASDHIASMTFHPGTQCTDPLAWATYIKECAKISKATNCPLRRLNVGGGFPSHRKSN